MTPEELRDTLVERNAEHETAYYLLITEEDAHAIANGYVPNTVRAMAATMLDWALEDERKAAVPVRQRRKQSA